jgi:hypothetical protein
MGAKEHAHITALRSTEYSDEVLACISHPTIKWFVCCHAPATPSEAKA